MVIGVKNLCPRTHVQTQDQAKGKKERVQDQQLPQEEEDRKSKTWSISQSAGS